MSKKLLLSSLVAVLLLSACEQVQNTGITDEPIQETPTDESPAANTEVTGVATIGLFGGTEMGCEYGELGSEVKCNSGSGTIYLDTNGEKTYLKDYTCDAVQYYLNDENGKHVEYRASGECDGEILIGETYTASGELSVEEGVWRNGKQVTEQWLTVDTVVLAK